MKVERKCNTYAVVDLEATGTGMDAKIIQIGIVIVENGQIRETFETDINPYEPLEHHIIQLTGITDQQLALAPDFGQVAGRIFELIGDAIFVAHNVRFDANLLAEALFFEGYDLLTQRVDTVELSQLFFPTLDKYGLGNLSRQLDLGLEQAHTAIADATATACLLLEIQDKIAQLPKQVVARILQLSDHLLYESRLVIEEVYDQMKESCPPDIELIQGIGLKKRKPVSEEAVFSKNFLDNINSLGLDERPQQSAFAQLIQDRLLDSGQVHLIQARAGIGKTLGYLLPLLAGSSDKILVTVPTKILQEQLMEQEGALLEQVFHTSISSIKAPKHYLKLDSFWKLLQEESDNRLANQMKMKLLVWLCQTETGDMTELKQAYRYPLFVEQLAHDGRLDKDSFFYEWDFWRTLQSDAHGSRILLTNHAYFLSHLKDQDPLMAERILVIDEAQKFLLAAEELTSTTQSIAPLLQIMQSKKDRAKNRLEQRLYESCLFELNQLLLDYRLSDQREMDEKDLKRLRQSVLEVKDCDLTELEDMLSFYHHFWIEEVLFDGKRQPYLRASKEEMLDLSTLLLHRKIFCISASLDISKHVNLADLLGFRGASFDRLDSPKPQNQLLLLPNDWPDLREMSKREYALVLLEQLDALQPLEEPILILFTSNALLQELSDLLDLGGIPHLAQHKHGEEASLKKRFDRGDCSLLLGTGAFWEGVDFANQPTIIQIITSLPFDNPKDRLVKKINHLLRLEGKNPFYDYSLPMMMMKLQQAIGRTNRSNKQASVVLLLDNRLLEKRYGKQVIDFLGKQYLFQIVPRNSLKEQIQNFLMDKLQ